VTSPLKRDAQLVAIEHALRQAIREALNRPTRKPFAWGGLNGYQQLEAIAQALHSVEASNPESEYLRQLAQSVERVVNGNRRLAEDVCAAHQGLAQIARCLHYPPAKPALSRQATDRLNSHQVAQEMERWFQQFQPHGFHQQAQKDLFSAAHKRWQAYGPELLICYAVPGLPPDNLGLEALFGRLRRHQRRISGRQSTRELQDFGQIQVLFRADSQAELLRQIQQISPDKYRHHRQQVAEAEAPRQFLHHLHRDPFSTIQALLEQHAARRQSLRAPHHSS
jgi:hypothetical protein